MDKEIKFSKIYFNKSYKLKVEAVRKLNKLHSNRGGINMCSKRPLYTNNEIVSLFNNKKKEANDTTYDLAKRFKIDEKTIELMQDRACQYNFKMLKIASEYLDIPYKSLVSFIEDDGDFCSLRANSTEEVKELNDVLSYIFDEMINQERLARV